MFIIAFTAAILEQISREILPRLFYWRLTLSLRMRWRTYV